MDAARTDRLIELFERAVELDVQQRRSFCDTVRRDDDELATELDSLLAAHEAPGSLEAFGARVLPEVLDRLSHTLAPNGPRAQQTVGHYLLLEYIGRGGMGEVYRARDLSLDRLVALKFLPRHLTTDPGARARLTREARAASALDHPNIAVVYEIAATEAEPGGREEGSLFIAMAYYAGETIKQKIARGPLPIADAIDYARQTAEGLIAAHNTGIVHRDIKPANLIVTDRTQLRILDFGLATRAGADVAQEGVTPGTLAYMSPEQTRGGPVDRATDLWSLGVVLYEMLTGVRPFTAESDTGLLEAIRHDPPPPLRQLRPETSDALQGVVERCLRKQPGDRYAQAEELHTDLRLLQAQARIAPAASRRRRATAAGLAAVAGTLLLFALLETVRDPATDTHSDPETAAIVATPRLAVLPFANLRADAETDFLGAALADEIISRLGRFEGLILRPSSAVRRYDGQVVDPQEAADTLKVDYLLTGSYLKDGDSLRVNLELVNPATGTPEWQEPLETAYEGVFRLQDLVADRVARRLGLGSAPEARTDTHRGLAVDPAAYNLYLRALAYPLLTVEGNRSASELLRRSIELDSSYAPAFTALGFRAYGLGAYLTDTRQQALEEAKHAFETALSLDPHDWQALSYQALLFIAAGRPEEALPPLRQALSIQPNAADAYISLGHVYRLAGLLEESARSFERARVLDPTNRRLSSAGGVYHYLRRYDDALDAFALAPYDPPSRFHQGHVLLEAGRAGLARQRFEAVIASDAAGPLFTRGAKAFLAYLDGERGRGVELVRGLERHAAEIGTDGEALYGFARLYALFDERPAAVRLFERAVDHGFFAYPFIVADPFVESVRDAPAFQRVLAKARTRHEAFRVLVSAEPLPQ